jgi:hypothetical protein
MLAVVGLCVGSALCYRSGKDGGYGEFSIYVSPDTIAKSALCNWVTIHTNMPFGAVEEVSAAVDGTDVEVANAFADDRGYLVVKLKFQDVVAVVDPPSATVELNVMVGGEVLGGAATVRVK